jgi:DNA-binding protein H-NS
MTELEDLLAELLRAQARTQQHLDQLSQETRAYRSRSQTEMREFKAEMQVFRDQMQADRIDMRKKWGELANKMGTMAEDRRSGRA